MMDYQRGLQNKLFYRRIDLDQRNRKNHILRKIASHIDFYFIYNEVKEEYGANGNVSVPPTVILKMMLLLILYNVRSERELLPTIPERLDWSWFLNYDLEFIRSRFSWCQCENSGLYVKLKISICAISPCLFGNDKNKDLDPSAICGVSFSLDTQGCPFI